MKAKTMNLSRTVSLARSGNLCGSIRQALRRRLESTVAAVFSWALSMRPVQEAVADAFASGTPMCQLLKDAVSDAVDNSDHRVDADDVAGLERFVERAIDDATMKVNADDVEDLDKAIGDALEEAIKHGDVVGDVIAAMVRKLDR